MPRHKRLEIPGAIYHVITRGIERKAIFNDDQDREEFLRRLAEGLNKTGNKCYGWVLMPNHLHLLIRTGVKPLGDLMRSVLTGYAMYFNARHKRRGYLYQNRYKSILCQEEVYLLELIRYIHLNPLRAKIVQDMRALNRFKWGGHSVLLGNRKAEFQSTGEILERFGETKRAAAKRYLEFIEDGKNAGKRDDLTGGGLRRSAGGWAGVYDLKRAKDLWRGDERVLGDGEFVNQVLKISEEEMVKKERLKKEGWDIYKVANRVCELMGIKEHEIKRRSRGNKISQARGLISFWSHRELGMNGVEIGKYFGITNQSVSEAITRGEKVSREKGYNL
jgi:putative transposase